jgi:hypothetical protein
MLELSLLRVKQCCNNGHRSMQISASASSKSLPRLWQLDPTRQAAQKVSVMMIQ